MDHYKIIAERISDTVQFLPRKLSMQKNLSTDAIIHISQDLIHSLQNTVSSSPLVVQVNFHKEEFISLAEIFGKTISPSEPLRVPIYEPYPEKIQ